jgi:hypothetical protein
VLYYNGRSMSSIPLILHTFILALGVVTALDIGRPIDRRAIGTLWGYPR